MEKEREKEQCTFERIGALCQILTQLLISTGSPWPIVHILVEEAFTGTETT